MGKPHVLAIPYPAQGHVIPLMEVAQCLANNGIRITFVNTELNHRQMMKALPKAGTIHELITLASIPDGLESWDERNDHGKVAETMSNIMPGKLESFIRNVKETGNDEITCVLSDFYMGWAMEVAERLGISRAGFLPASVAMMALSIDAGKLVDDGIIDDEGKPLNKQMIQLSPSMPAISPMNLPWACFDPNTRKALFHCIINNNKLIKQAELMLCNSSYDLEPGALAFAPNCLPIGPLLARNRLGNPTGHFWPEDPSCLEWLDQQPPRSVVYIAFGSFTIFNKSQFQELALGLELANRPFLWVVRRDIIEQEVDNDEAYPNGFLERVKNLGKIVSWAPQQEVLSHRSIACFLSHCGWNSTLEGLCNGVPFLCWPYFADQFVNERYVCDHWEIGLGLEKDGNGIITREEIKDKVDKVLSDGSYKKRALELQDKAMGGVTKGGCSEKNFNKFVDWIKENVPL